MYVAVPGCCNVVASGSKTGIIRDTYVRQMRSWMVLNDGRISTNDSRSTHSDIVLSIRVVCIVIVRTTRRPLELSCKVMTIATAAIIHDELTFMVSSRSAETQIGVFGSANAYLYYLPR
jgi:hypothetical protein